MSHNGNSASGDDLGSTDEVKVFKDEGDREDEKNSSENLFEEKSSLIDLTESEFASFQKKNKSQSAKSDSSTPVFAKIDQTPTTFNMGYLMSHYGSYANGAALGSKMGLPQFFCHSSSETSLTTPPPAHCGIPPYQLDPKMMGLAGRPFFATTPYPYPILSPDISPSQLGPSWHTPTAYASPNFKNPYSSADFSFRFSPNIYHSPNNGEGMVIGNNQHIGSSFNMKPDSVPNYSNAKFNSNRSVSQQDSKDANKSFNVKESQNSKDVIDKKKPHIKKPLNAFMLYMKEMRAKVVNECTLKESAAINKILGQKWHELNREEQSKYYEKARKERQLHMELYPGWSARDNYGYVSKKKKHKKDRQPADSLANTMKKCRARFGLDQQNKWCKPCRRKKKCIFYTETQKNDNNSEGDSSKHHAGSDNYNLESCSSIDDLKAPDDDADSFNQSLSSPGGLSNLSSLQSPSASIASHSNQITSPATPGSCQGDINQQMHHQFLQNTLHQKELLSPGSFNQSIARKNNEHDTSLFQNSVNSSNICDSNISKKKLCRDLTGSNEQQTSSMMSIESLKEPSSPIDDKSLVNKILPFVQSKSHNEQKRPPPKEQSVSPVNTKETGKNMQSSSQNSGSSLGSSSSSTISSNKSFSPIFEDPFGNSSNSKSDNILSSPSPVVRNPVGANPRDINNPLNIKQLTNRNDVLRINNSPVAISNVGSVQSSVCSSNITSANSTVTFPSSPHPSENFSTFSHLENSITSFMRQHKSFSSHTAAPQSHYHQMITETTGMPFPQHIPHMGHYFGSMAAQPESLSLINNQFTTDSFKKQANNNVGKDHLHKAVVDNASGEKTSKSGAISVT